MSAAASYMEVLYFTSSHARCPCSFGASRDDLHPRTGCLPPLTRSGEVAHHNRQPESIQGIHICLLDTIATFEKHFAILQSIQIEPPQTTKYQQRHLQNPHNLIATMPTPIDRALNSRVCSPEISRSYTQADTIGRTSSSALPVSSQQRQHGRSGVKTCSHNCKILKATHRSGRTKR